MKPTTARRRWPRSKRRSFDIILLDIGLPDIDGRDVCRQMRAQGVRSPIIMLTAADSDDDTITGLNAGANDYVTKPFRMAVLLARVRAHLRQRDQSDDAILRSSVRTNSCRRRKC